MAIANMSGGFLPRLGSERWAGRRVTNRHE